MSPIPIEQCVGGADLTEPRLSPDGSALVYARSAGGESVLLVAALDGVDGPTRVLTSTPAPRTGRGLGGGCFCWLPDSSAVIYAALDGNLWQQPIAGGEPTVLTPDGADLGPSRAAQAPMASPTADGVVFVVDQREVWLQPLPSGRPLRLDDSSADFCFDPWVEADGTSAVWQAWNVPDMAWDASRVQSAPLGGGGVTDVVRPAGAVQQPRPAADGRMLCVRDDSGWNNLWFGDEPLVDEPFEHAGPTWGLGQRSFAVNDDGTAIAFTRNEHGFGRLCVVDVATRQVSDVARGVHGQLSWSGSRLAAVRTGASTPTQIVVYDTTTWARDVIDVGPHEAWSATELVEPELIDVPTRDGEIIHARLYRHEPVDGTQAGAASERLMCFVHGGPTDQWQVTFMPRIAFWRSQGYDVLVVDHRGSTGHGRAYQQAMNGRWGELDVADVVDAVSFAHENGWGAPSRTVLLGGSAGGFTVLGALAEAPRLAAAGVVSYPVTDLFDLAERSHRFEQHYTHHLVGPVPVTAPADGPYVDRSPVSFAARITSPLLMFHGEVDPVVPVEQSRVMATRIAEANGIVALVTYPGEGHGFRQRDHQLDEYRRTLSFLADHFVEDSSVRLAPVSEWNATDPEAAKVFYDLSSWDFDQQAELASALADAEIPHSWEGIELVIPPEAEDATDAIFAELEERLQIASAADTDDGDDGDDGKGDDGEVVPRELADDTPITDYDLTEWADLERSLVIESLGVANIPFRFDAGVLSVPTTDEGRVDDILDEVESGDIIPVIHDGPDGDVVPFESLNSFFLAGERLRKDARDADGLERLLEALEIADPNRPPRGVELRVWRRTCELAESLADALADDAEPEDVQAIAEALHDLLRPLI